MTRHNTNYQRNNNNSNRGGGQQYGGGGRNNRSNDGRIAPKPGGRPRNNVRDGNNRQQLRNNSNNRSNSNAAYNPGDPNTYFDGKGVLELHPDGYGFLRDPNNDYIRQLSDPFVPASMIDRFCLREGVLLEGLIQPTVERQGPRLREIYNVDGLEPDKFLDVKQFDELTPINPESWLRLETGPFPLTTRVMDILTPLGKGQRALIVAPPRSGKTILLHHISQAVVQNYPDVKVIVLLVDERPEEVTDFRRAVNTEVVASSLDCEIESHIRLAQLVVERCRRLAEMGKDVFLLLDSITRLARAFNKWVGNTGRTMSGGVDIKAMDIPKKLFATARAFEEGGSLTIVGTALIETGSRMDDLIFQEFKGTGNMELVLDRRLAERRIWPAIDMEASGTRREEKLLPKDLQYASTLIRRTLASRNPTEAMESLTTSLQKCNSNMEFFQKFIARNARDEYQG